MLRPLGTNPILLPAYQFNSSRLFPDQAAMLEKAATEEGELLLVFTSPRSVEFGLDQIPAGVLPKAKLAAVGPTTASLLNSRGMAQVIRPEKGYNSEDLLRELHPAAGSSGQAEAFIFAAPGGRTVLKEGLEARGYKTHMLMVYEHKPAELPSEAVAAIEKAESLLAVWTSANAMNSLSQRLPARCWYRLCRGDWLVTSARLMRVARAFSPQAIHLAKGPSNTDLLDSIQALGHPRESA